MHECVQCARCTVLGCVDWKISTKNDAIKICRICAREQKSNNNNCKQTQYAIMKCEHTFSNHCVTWCAHCILSLYVRTVISIETNIKQLWNTISNCIHSSTGNSIETKSLSIRCDYFEIKDDDDDEDDTLQLVSSLWNCENEATQFAYFIFMDVCFFLCFCFRWKDASNASNELQRYLFAHSHWADEIQREAIGS